MNQTETQPSGEGREPTRPAFSTPKATPRRPAHKTSLISGRHRHRSGGKMKTIAGGHKVLPDSRLTYAAGGFMFSPEKATPKQMEAFEEIVADYLRRCFIRMYADEFPTATLAAAMGMKPRAAAYLVASTREGRSTPEANLTLGILHAMFTGKIAGIHGTRRTETTRRVFYLVDQFSLENEHDMTIRLLLDDEGKVVSEDQYMQNSDMFRKVHAAFRLDYMSWRNG
jgi:hypothetical protein